MKQNSTALGPIRRDVRPPIPPDSAPQPGAVEGLADIRAKLRRTVWPRRLVAPKAWHSPRDGYPASSRYVRTFWTAYLGPGAVADLLRLATAASRGRSLPRPVNLSRLCEAGLAREIDGQLEVRVAIPALTPVQLRTLHPAVRRLHDRWDDDAPSAA